MRSHAEVLPVYLDSDLLSNGWDGSVEPYPGITTRQFAFQSLRNSFLKKFQDTKDSTADDEALSLFKKVNESCRKWSRPNQFESDLEAVAIGEMQIFIDRFFNDVDYFSLANIERNFGLGNGANIGSRCTSFFSKLSTSRMTCSDQSLYTLYVQAISNDPIWSSVESTRSKNRPVEVVPGSRLSFVPKTRKISRTICTEPILNMLYQKGMAALLERRLREFCGISLSTQPDLNRHMALLGSLDGRFGTIDLSSASDSMSNSLVEWLFPRRIVNLLRLCRSPFTILPDGTVYELHMVSSMGNAFTFPLQTLLFCAVVYGAYRAYGLAFDRPIGRKPGNFAVFGDDIIVVSKAYDLVTKMLSILGFTVNVDKSFNTGLFRESCGLDFYQGRNVRGIYIKSLLTVNDRFSAINRLNRWCATWNVTLTKTVGYLLNSIKKKFFVPFDEMDDVGVKVPLALLRNVRLERNTGGVIYRCSVVKPTRFSLADVEIRPPTRLPGYVNNPDGVLLAALAGTLRDTYITMRMTRDIRVVKRRFSSSWDFIYAPRYCDSGFVDRWKSVVEQNLNFS